MARNKTEKEPRYVISIAAQMLGTQTYTLRYYEKIGLIEPYRSKGRIRLYSDTDIELLKRVKTFVEDMGVNLAGVEVILRLMQHMNELQDKLETMEAEVKHLKEKER